MTKKQKFEKPIMEVIEMDMNVQILTGSTEAYGINNSLIEDEEVEEAWSRRHNGSWDDNEE